MRDNRVILSEAKDLLGGMTLCCLVLMAACKKDAPAPTYQAVPDERRNIVVSA